MIYLQDIYLGPAKLLEAPKSKWRADKAGTASGAPKSPRVESVETQAQSKRQKMLPRNIQGLL